ncbi:MAG: hypothetical protein MK078_02715 [Crocinitomicaceae bacterium]|nr:hypothetical protein [Crocinitomicaceae bacterium]
MIIKRRNECYRELGITGLLFLILWFALSEITFIYVGIGVVILGVVAYPFRKANGILWEHIKEVVGFATQAVFLFLIYFLFVVPIGFFYKRRMGKRELEETSTWRNVDRVFNKEDLQKPW